MYVKILDCVVVCNFYNYLRGNELRREVFLFYYIVYDLYNFCVSNL